MNRAPRTAERTAGRVEPRYFSTQVFSAQRFFLDLNPRPGPELRVVSGGCERCRPDYAIRRPGFPHPTIEFVAGGRGQLFMGRQRHALLPGTVFAYDRRWPHRIASDAHEPLVKYFVVLAGTAGRQLMEECRVAPGRVVRVTRPDRVQEVFDDLISHARSDHSDRMRLCALCLQYLIMKIGDLAAPHDGTSGRAFANYERCRQYIAERYAQLRTMTEVAQGCHIDPAYLCRLFRRFGRESPLHYLQHLRLNRAAELLQGSDRMVKDVAAELGFGDAANFSRAFRRVFGIAPARFGRQP